MGLVIGVVSAGCHACHAAFASDGAASALNQTCPTPRARQRPQKCSQVIQHGVFHRLFRNRSVFFFHTVGFQKPSRALYLLNPTVQDAQKALSFVETALFLFGNKQYKEQGNGVFLRDIG
jgi:hypothetical protein